MPKSNGMNIEKDNINSNYPGIEPPMSHLKDMRKGGSQLLSK